LETEPNLMGVPSGKLASQFCGRKLKKPPEWWAPWPPTAP